MRGRRIVAIRREKETLPRDRADGDGDGWLLPIARKARPSSDDTDEWLASSGGRGFVPKQAAEANGSGKAASAKRAGAANGNGRRESAKPRRKASSERGRAPAAATTAAASVPPSPRTPEPRAPAPTPRRERALDRELGRWRERASDVEQRLAAIEDRIQRRTAAIKDLV